MGCGCFTSHQKQVNKGKSPLPQINEKTIKKVSINEIDIKINESVVQSNVSLLSVNDLSIPSNKSSQIKGKSLQKKIEKKLESEKEENMKKNSNNQQQTAKEEINIYINQQVYDSSFSPSYVKEDYEKYIDFDSKVENIQVEVRTLKGNTLTFLISKLATESELAKHVYEVMKMHQNSILFYNGIKLEGSKLLYQRNIIEGKKMIIHEREKSSMVNRPLRINCSHCIHRDELLNLIESRIEAKQADIKCPKCDQLWNYDQCSKIGNFSPSEKSKYANLLEENAIKKCPFCRKQIFKDLHIKNNMKCPCNPQRYCYDCLKSWNSKDNDLCGNKNCIQANQLRLKLKKYSCLKQIKVPHLRMCPDSQCGKVNKRQAGSKESKIATCSGCTKRFCWICLSSEGNSQSLFNKCISYQDQYCGDGSEAP